MKAKTNKGNRTPFPRIKAQGSMEYMIILAVVIIGAIIAGVLYLHSISHTQIGNAESIMAAGSPNANTLVLALSEPLPAGATFITPSVSGVTQQPGLMGTPTSSVTYVNNYPEYVFGGAGISAGETVSGLYYYLNGKNIRITTSTGKPLTIQATSGDAVTP